MAGWGCTGGMEMKEQWGNSERSDVEGEAVGEVGGGGSGVSQRRRANSRPCFPNCHLKGTNGGTAGREKGVQVPVPGFRRDVLTSPPLRHGCVGERTNKQNQFRHRRGFKQMRRDGNIEGSGVKLTLPRKSVLFSCLSQSTTRVCAGKAKRPVCCCCCCSTLCTLPSFAAS